MTEDTPLPKTLDTQMRCGIFSSAAGDILIVHDMPLESAVQWVEYRPKSDAIVIVYEDGKAQDLGIILSEDMKANLSHGLEITLSHLADDVIQSSQHVTFVIQDY